MADKIISFGVSSCIQVQYEEKEAANKLQQALSEMQISAQVTKLGDRRGSQTEEQKLLDNADAELTLKLLQITPKEKELEVKRSDSEFLRDFRNSTSGKQFTAAGFSQAIIMTTDGSDEMSIDGPSLE